MKVEITLVIDGDNLKYNQQTSQDIDGESVAAIVNAGTELASRIFDILDMGPPPVAENEEPFLNVYPTGRRVRF